MLSRRSYASRRTPQLLARLLLMTAGCWLSVAGCGYQPLGAGAGPGGQPPDIQRVHLAALANETYKPGLQGLVGAAILRRLQQDGRVRAASRNVADAVLGGSIRAYENIPIAYDQNDVGKRFRVRIRLALTLTERAGEKVLLKEETFGEAYYTAGTNIEATRSAEEEAAQRAAQDLAVRVVTQIADGL